VLRLQLNSKLLGTIALTFLLPNLLLRGQDNTRLDAGTLAANIELHAHHLTDTHVHDALSGRTISLGDAFSLVMQDGRVIRASQMHLEQPPVLLSLSADTSV